MDKLFVTTLSNHFREKTAEKKRKNFTRNTFLTLFEKPKTPLQKALANYSSKK